jgi:BirA family transcriptional regulator, biotin operon repressor / biotin---[acetyl-CoA-carboxylase] ligase
VSGPIPSTVGPAIPVRVLETVDSTNSEARRLADAGEFGPRWITARHQSVGRGRRGRNWDTADGNLAATLLTSTDRSPGDAARTSFIAAVAVADMLSAYAPDSLIRLKWPNDVLLDQRKVCGILIESGRIATTDRLWLAIGIGVNLAHAPLNVDRPATALAEHLRGDMAAVPTPLEALDRLAAAFAVRQGQWDRDGFEPIIEAWTQRAIGLGGLCTARLADQTVEGIAEGLDPDGSLRLRLADGEVRRISAGDVFFGGR